MDRATDTAIWHFAKQFNFIIVTYDSDFAERSKLWGAPPKVVWLRCGNSSAAHIEELLRKHSQSIFEFANQFDSTFMEIF